jgi:hypothetical protein
MKKEYWGFNLRSGGVHQWERGEHKESVNEGEYGGCTLYSCTKME